MELRVFENKDRRSRAYHAARDGSSGSRVPSPESPRRRIFESPSPSPPLSDGSMMYSDSRSSTSASPAFSTPVHLTSPPFLPLPRNFSEEEVQKFETRLEEGFDIPDKRYAMWLRVNKLEKFAAARNGRSNSLPTHRVSQNRRSFPESILGPYCTKYIFGKWSVFADPVTFIMIAMYIKMC